MAGLIKKQILKHLSRFTKNLSPDKINLSTLKGEGQLSNLELDEEVLQNMLDLPTWLAVTRVYCNKAAIRIQWTKLKTNPICLFLDKVEVEMRTCEEPRSPNGPSPIAITAGQSEYGFAEKVVEGMSVVINSIAIRVQARAFRASFELWQLHGTSLNPKWQRSDLRYTRITDPKRGEVLTFKEINWQSLRIEADAMEGEEQDLGSTPLRLITNQGRIRIALKRRVKDCNVLASKLLFILDDLLWVLTDSQLKAVIHYAKSLSEAMERSAQQRKSMANESLQTAPPSPSTHTLWNEPVPPPSDAASNLNQYFELHDVKESSYHTFISRLDLHICNDSSSQDPGEPQPRGALGAMQLTFRKLGFDYYPFHRPGDSCRHWERYCSAMETHAQWAEKLLQEFQQRMEGFCFMGPHTETPSKKTPDTFSKLGDGDTSPKSSLPDQGQRSRRSSTAPGPSATRSPWKRLRSSCIVVRIDDLDIRQVSTGGRHSKKTQSLLSCNRKAFHVGDGIPAIHGQFTEYYLPDNPGLPVPCSSLYAQMSALQLCVDPASVLWVSLFSQGLLHTLDQVKAFYHLQDGGKGEEHVDTRLDVTHLRVVIPLESSILDHPDRPRYLSITVPQGVLSNTRHCPHSSRADLHATCCAVSACRLFQPLPPWHFPRDQSTFQPLPRAFFHHASEMDCMPQHRSSSRSQDFWALSLSRLALCFEGACQRSKGRPQPFVEPFAISIWMCRPGAFELRPSASSGRLNSSSENCIRSSPTYQEEELHGREVAPLASIHILAQSVSPVKMWLNHYQYVALLRMKDMLASLAAELSQGTKQVRKDREVVDLPTMCMVLLIDTLEVGLLLPPAAGEPKGGFCSPEETDSPSLTDSDLSPSRVTTQPGLLEESGIGSGSGATEREAEGPVEEACEAVEEADEGNETSQVEPVSPPLLPSHQQPLSRQPSSFSLEGELSSALNATKDATKDALSASLDLTKGAFSITKDALSLLSRGSAMSKFFTPQAREQVQRHEETPPPAPGRWHPTPVRQSPSQHSFDSAILDGSLPEDGLSLDSDISDNFAVLADSESGLESMRLDSTHYVPTDLVSRSSPAPGTEGDSSADLSSSLSQSTEDFTQDTASVLLLQLGSLSSVLDVKGEDQVLALEAQSLTARQLGNQRVSKVLGGTVPQRVPAPSPCHCGYPPMVRMRMETGPSGGQQRTQGHSDCSTFLPQDDGPLVYPTAPQPVPTVFSLDRLVLERTDDGIFRLRANDRDATKLGVRMEGHDSMGKTEACWKPADHYPSVPPQEDNKVQSPSLVSQLIETQEALAHAISDRERLLQELHKYDPLFSL
ncbi:UHRF1-binding protein 1 [Arapaima gigas]